MHIHLLAMQPCTETHTNHSTQYLIFNANGRPLLAPGMDGNTVSGDTDYTYYTSKANIFSNLKKGLPTCMKSTGEKIGIPDGLANQIV